MTYNGLLADLQLGRSQLMRVGLDFGTTNSSAAVFDGKRVRLLSLG